MSITRAQQRSASHWERVAAVLNRAATTAQSGEQHSVWVIRDSGVGIATRGQIEDAEALFALTVDARCAVQWMCDGRRNAATRARALRDAAGVADIIARTLMGEA